jgi:hypothetical protein
MSSQLLKALLERWRADPARFLDACSCCSADEQVIAAIHRLDERRIRGLGPASESMARFGEGLRAVDAIARTIL